MRHRATRLHAMVAALLVALGAMCATAAVAPLTSSGSDPSAVSQPRVLEGAHGRHEALAPRATTASTPRPVLHVDVVAVLAALATGAILLLGWFVARSRTTPLPRLVTASLGARAPPALV